MGGILGIVSEYNPFHNGHLMHLNYSKDLTKADFTIAIMTGNFVQRGEPALLDINLRTKAAVNCGVDLVLSLPLPYCIATAEKFALAGVTVLDSLKSLDSIAFGSECNSPEKLKESARNLKTPDFDELVS